MPDLSGITVGKYHIIEKLGSGGMATVFKAFDMRLERNVAIKVIRREAFSPEVVDRMLQRFEREAKALSKLTHPNIMPIIDFGDDNGSPYLVMPLIVGGTLKDILAIKIFTPIEASRLLVPIASALEYAHSRGVLHRDVKPSNILITESGDPILSDFGIAKVIEDGESATLTGTGIGLGTPEYMAPEQWIGRASAASDQYSLGVVFYEMITGHKPYTAETPAAILLKQANDPLPRPSSFVKDLPEAAEKVIYKSMAKNPEDRFLNLKEFAAALRKIKNFEPNVPVELKYDGSEKTCPIQVTDAETVDELKNGSDLRKSSEKIEENRILPDPKRDPGKNRTFNYAKGILLLIGGIAILTFVIGNSVGWFPKDNKTASSVLATEKAMQTKTIQFSLESTQTTMAMVDINNQETVQAATVPTMNPTPKTSPTNTQQNVSFPNLRVTTQNLTNFRNVTKSSVDFDHCISVLNSGLGSSSSSQVVVYLQAGNNEYNFTYRKDIKSLMPNESILICTSILSVPVHDLSSGDLVHGSISVDPDKLLSESVEDDNQTTIWLPFNYADIGVPGR